MGKKSKSKRKLRADVITRKSRRRKHGKKMRTQAERIEAGDRGPIGWAEAKRRRWAVRTLMRKQGGLCALCGEQMNLVAGDDQEATLDHIVPVSNGGLDVITNLQLAHRSCNEARGNQPITSQA